MMVIPIGVQQKLIDKIVERVGGKMNPCPMCGKTDYFLAHQIFMIETTDTLQERPGDVFKGLSRGTGVSPHLSLICNNCGHSFFINAAVLGVLELLDTNTSGFQG